MPLFRVEAIMISGRNTYLPKANLYLVIESNTKLITTIAKVIKPATVAVARSASLTTPELFASAFPLTHIPQKNFDSQTINLIYIVSKLCQTSITSHFVGYSDRDLVISDRINN